jgi:hypothetical protein
MAWFRLAFRPAVIQDLTQIDPVMAQRLFDKTKWIASNGQPAPRIGRIGPAGSK